MAEQLTILGLWEPVELEERPPSAAVASAPIESRPTAAVGDSRQVELWAGSHPLRSAIEDACVALDPEAVRRAYAELVANFAAQEWAKHVPEWADGLAWLTQVTSAGEAAQRALWLESAEIANQKLPHMPSFLRELVRRSALVASAHRLVAEKGPLAALPDGKPAGYLALSAGEVVLARRLLSEACEASPQANGQWLGYLGEAAWAGGEPTAALRAYSRASLLDASRIDEASVRCTPVLEVLEVGEELDLPLAPVHYLCVLADLLAKQALDDEALLVPPSASDAQRLAAGLRRYRQKRDSGRLSEEERLRAKRELLALAPGGMRELLRRL